MKPEDALPPSFQDPLLEAFRAALVRRWKPIRRKFDLEVDYETEGKSKPGRDPHGRYEWVRLLAKAGHRAAQLDLVERRILSVDVRIQGRCLFSLRRAHAVGDAAAVLAAFESTGSSLVLLGSSEHERATIDSIGDAWTPVITAPDYPDGSR